MSSTTNNNTIRAADLSETVYIPRTPSRKQPLAINALASPPPESRAVNPESHHPTLAELRAKFMDEQSLSGISESARTSLPVAEPIVSEKAEEPTSSKSIFANQPLALGDEVAAEVPRQLETVRVWGIDYHSVTMVDSIDYLDQIIAKREPTFAITANLNYAMLCVKHPRLQAFTKRASLVLCDGMPIFWRSKLNKKSLPERVAGSDLIYQLSERCAAKQYRMYLYGAAEGVAEAAAAQLQNLYPLLQIAGVQCPPFHDSSSATIQDQVARIKKARPDVLLVALGQPKGEYWIEDHLKELGVPLAIQLGASFDFVAGRAKRAPKWMQRTGLEWLYRAVQDPWRLIPRYWDNFMFLLRSIRREMIDSLS
jgi:N-acetylglucosaminyldiphosphoundecaprenol N-acetyl-beta-D-mannosaminyltransferase